MISDFSIPGGGERENEQKESFGGKEEENEPGKKELNHHEEKTHGSTNEHHIRIRSE